MKKMSILLFTVALMVSLAACNGAKKTEAPAEVIESDPVELVAEPETPPAVQKAPAVVLKEFQAFAKEYATAFNNAAKDPQKFMELANQVSQKITDAEQIKDELNSKQQKEFQKAKDLIIKVNKGGQ
ncbi:MAG: hypothetical protein LBT25_09185 [Candidatus Symbiothrix sp.]|jgi:hypothetical protein|nr:hypothetical protein [Candidatus Symbiothrix sp.]